MGLNYILTTEKWRNGLPDLSEDDILSRSKAHGPTKAFVCIQALWFITQCITRLAQRIPISLLELNTFGHCVCALLVYFFWWYKSFDVSYPTLVDERFWSFRALDFIRGDVHSSPLMEAVKRQMKDLIPRLQEYSNLSESEKERLHEYPRNEFDLLRVEGSPGSDGDQQAGDEDLTPNIIQTYHTTEEDLNTNTNETSKAIQKSVARKELRANRTLLDSISEDGNLYTILPGQYLPGTGLKLLSNSKTDSAGAMSLEKNDMGVYFRIHPPLPPVHLTQCDVNRWKVAWETYDTLGPARILCRRCKDWPDLQVIFDHWISLGFIAATMVYGGLHALAWNAHFDSPTEQLLWRVSACVVMGGFSVGFCGYYSLESFGDAKYELATRHSSRSLAGWAQGRFYQAVLILLWCLLLFTVGAYALARTYLVVECFINLAHLPAEAYKSPSWSVYFPHIS